MGQFIIKITDESTKKDYYMEWCTVVDSPITYGMSLEEFKEHYQAEYGKESMQKLEERLSRVEKTGCSGRGHWGVLEDYFSDNHAGDNDENLDKEGILEKYCRNIPTE